jgi:hypothetical protein
MYVLRVVVNRTHYTRLSIQKCAYDVKQCVWFLIVYKQNSWFCKEIREDNFRFWWRRVHEDASQGMYVSKIEIFSFYCSNIAKSENAMLWRMLSRLETCIVYSCIWSVTLAKFYTVDYMCPTKTSKSPHAFARCSTRTELLKQENEKIDSL